MSAVIPFADLQRDISYLRGQLANASHMLPGREGVVMPQGTVLRLAKYKARITDMLYRSGIAGMAPAVPRIRPGSLVPFSGAAGEVIEALGQLSGALEDMRSQRGAYSAAMANVVRITDAAFEQSWADLEASVAPLY